MKEKTMDLDLLELLTQEVTKEDPEEEKLKQYMKKAGIKYSKDPIARIHAVLQEIHFMEKEEKENG
ncbi:MAG: hypothetical protein H6625_05095 [Bdellovibrionaceae bacterium]|nr:hypothetical protein [Pseudobdellovibrionaceae bacterium]